MAKRLDIDDVVYIPADNSAEINGMWVEESYRHQGIGTYLLGVIEREAKEQGTYLFIGNACDWNIGFFQKERLYSQRHP